MTFRVEVEPAGNLEAVLEANAGMAVAGKLTKKAMPKNPVHLVNLGSLSQTYLPGIPIWMQDIGLAMGSLTGRMLGIDPQFSSYRALAAGTAPAAAAEVVEQAA